MLKNRGAADRIIRILLALTIGRLYYTGVLSGTLAVVPGIVAIVFLLMSLVSFCPRYRILGINTCKVRP